MMHQTNPSRVLITGGHNGGGVASFASALQAGFIELGLSAEVIEPQRICRYGRELRDCDTLKILSTTAVFACPLARRAICVAHGFPRADVQGWLKQCGILGSFRLAAWQTHLVAVSHYVAAHLRAIFNLPVAAVIHNPLDPLFLEPNPERATARHRITYVGRLHPSKRLDNILPAIEIFLQANADWSADIVGDGPLRAELEAATHGNPRIHFTGTMAPQKVREALRRTTVFVSGCETEALGIAYLEALSQGCAVVMPTSGGGIEIAPELIGQSVHLFADFEAATIVEALRRALLAQPRPTSWTRYSPRFAAQRYLDLDRRLVCQTIAPRQRREPNGSIEDRRTLNLPRNLQ